MSYVNVKNHRSFDGLMKELFNEFPAVVSKTMREDILHFPPVNIIETTEGFKLSLSVPGFEKTDFAVKLDNNILQVSASKKAVENVETEKFVRNEFSVKSFKRSFTLNEKIDADQITAQYENGILNINLMKKAPINSTVKEISII
ncbi:Hsp20/alpha crystallin family protein [Ferruginibacter yonginensis]|uniref:Hsp20/alpha crystallin family protein n=1 Tax=Ferruginibacter yonginensis TaxID=1310416 RepID=A0ABV8QPK1_9BACT